jgi:hypothetical protein
MQVPVLSEFRFDPSLDWFQATIQVADAEAALCLSVSSDVEASGLLNENHHALVRLEEILQSAKEYSAKELIDLKNGEWAEQDGSIVTEQQFVERLALESAILYPDGEMEFFFRDGGLFFGHVVIVSRSADGEHTNATIAG